ncbi:hypothetical protein B0H14DRAFT_2627629 [Mycena olivaceomarginata]|nr:hypothetical protein B0H14DRAFT_2627629 [Mycena olivaceomarginata]
MLQSRTPPLPLCWQHILYGPLQFQLPIPTLRPARYATGLCHRIPLRGIQGGEVPPANANWESSRSLTPLDAAAFASASGVTLVRTAHPPAVTPRRTAGAQYPTAGARHHHWYRHGRARSSYSHRHRTVGKRVRRHGVDRPQPGQ